MPMKPITVKANFQLDTSAARSQLQGLQKELTMLTKTSTSQLGVTQQITEAVKAAELLKQTLAQATNVNTGTLDLSRFTASIRENMTSIEQFKSSLQSLGPAGEKAFNSLAMNIATAQVPLQRSSQLLGQFRTAFSNAMKWQVSSMAIHKVTSEISKAFNYAQSLDKSLNRIQIVSGHSAEYMKDFAIQANNAAKALSASTLEYSNAALIYYQQGLSDKEVQKRTETTIKMAKVSGEAASTVSQQMTAVWNNFSNGLDNLERYADVMTALGATTASSSAEIAKGLEKFAGISKTIGLSYDYAASALATVTAQTRQSADSVGTAFKTLFSRLESLNLGETLDDGVTLNKYSEALMKVGVNVLDVNGQLKNMDTILDDLGGRWDNLNKAQQVALAQTIGGVRNYTSLITLMDNWEKFQTNVTTSQLAEGTLQKQADIYAQSWEAAQQRVQTAAQGIYNSLISSDFFKGLNNVAAFALNGISGLGKALGTGGSVAGLGMLINSLYKENLTTGINNLGNNLLANTAYGQRQALNVKNQLFDEFSKDFEFRDKTLEPFRKDILETAKKSSNDFMKNRESLPTRAAQQAYANALMQTNTEGIQALNRLSEVDNFKAVGSKMLKAETAQKITGMSTAGKNYYTAAAERLLANSDMQMSGKAVAQAFMSQFGKNMLLATEDPKIAAQLQEQVKQFNEANLSALQGNGAMKGVIKSITDLAPGAKLDASAYSLLNKYILRETGKESVILDKAVKAEVQKAGYDLESKEGQTQVEKLTETVKGYYNTQGSWAAEDALARYAAQSNITKQKNLIGTLQNMSTQPGGLLSVKQHYRLDKNGNPVIDKSTGEKVMAYNEMSMGAFTMQTAQMMNSIAMATNSISNFGKSISEGNVTFSNFAATLGSTGLALGQTLNFMQNNSALMGFMGSSTGIKAANWLGKMPGIGGAFKTVNTAGETTGLSSLGGGVIAAGITAAIFAGIKGYQLLKANDMDAKISKANEDKIQMASLAKEDKTKYENFLSISQTQNESLNKLLGLQQGTAAYTSQLVAVNEQARDMIDTYNLKAGTDYSIMQNGAINFSAEQIANINDRLLEQSKESSLLAQLSSSRITQLEAVKNNAYNMRQVSKIKVETVGEEHQNIEDYATNVIEKTDEEYAAELQKAKQDYIENSAIAKADYQQSLQSVVAFTDTVTDAQKLAVDMLGMDAKKAEEYSKGVYNLAKAGGVTRKVNGEYLSEQELRAIYAQEDYFGEAAAAGMTQEQLAAAIESKGAERLLWDQINDIAPDLNASQLKEYSNYSQISAAQLNDLIDRTSNLGGENEKAYRSLNNLALSKQAESIDNLAQALQTNTNFQEMNYLQTANELLESRQLSIDQMNTLSNYINNFGVNFGDNAGKYIYEALTSTRTGLNNELLTFLQKNSFDNSISGLASLERAIGLNANTGLNATLNNLRDSILLDVRDRGGLAQALFGSSDFQNVFESLQNTFQSTGEITAQNVMDLAKKNEIIGDYLQINGGNAAAVADMASLIASGRLSISDLTPQIESFINQASSSDGAMQKALEYLNEQDYSDSLSNLDKWAQNIGKAFYTGRTNDMTFDAPVREALKDLLSPDDWKTFNDIIYQNGFGGSTKDILSAMQKQMPEAYKLLTTLGGTGKRSGKGGGGMDDVYHYIAGQAGFKDRGIIVDKEGRFSFDRSDKDQNGQNKFQEEWNKYWESQGLKNVQVTFDTLNDYIKSIFTENNWSTAEAEKWTTMMMGKMSASSMGSLFEAAGVVQGTKDLFKKQAEENGQEVEPTDALTLEQLKAVYDQYQEGFSHVVFDEEKDENGKPTGRRIIREATQKEVESGKAGISREDYIKYVAEEAKANGTALIGLGENYGVNGVTTAAAIGNQLQQNSLGTLSVGGIEGLIEAAVKSGVNLYQNTTSEGHEAGKALDFEELQKFYTETLGLSQEVFESNLNDIIKSGTNLNYRYTDIFGDTHTITSHGKTAEEFQQEVKSQTEEDQVRQMMEQKWLNDALAGGVVDPLTGKEVDPNDIKAVQAYRTHMRQQAQEKAKSQEPYGSSQLSQETATKYVEGQSAEIVKQNAQAAQDLTSIQTTQGYLNQMVNTITSGGLAGFQQLGEIAQQEGWGDTFQTLSDALVSQFGLTQANGELGGFKTSALAGLSEAGFATLFEDAIVGDIKDSYTSYSSLQAKAYSGSSVSDREAMINAAAEKAKGLVDESGKVDTSQLTPFEKQLLTAVGEINETTDGMYELSEDQAKGETAADRAKSRKTLDEEGNVVDENGNIIMPSEMANEAGTQSGWGAKTTTSTKQQTSWANKRNSERLFNAVLGGDQDVINLLNAGFSQNDVIQFLDKKEEKAAIEAAPGKQSAHSQANNPGAVFCFAAGTQILMDNGLSKNIEDIKIDEIIIAYNENNKKFVAKKVINTQAHNNTPQMVQISFNNGDILKLTPGHPLLSIEGWKSLDTQASLQGHNVITTLLTIGDIILGINKLAIVTNIEYLPIEGNNNSYNIDIEDCHTYLANGFIAHNKATGQNNARILGFASGKKEGHIAVTGELGPELRIKSDGSADLLGKQGREYTWVNTDDIIYTATQTAGILGNNSIPALEGLAKGIRNYIPGYFDAGTFSAASTDEGGSSSSKGGGGGSGGKDDKDPRYDPNTLKIRDIVERCYTVLQQLDDITKAVEHIGKEIDRGWGQERLKNLDRQEKLLEKQYKMQENYVKELKEYVKTDKDTLTTMISEFVTDYNKGKDEKDKLSWEGAEFDENGVLTNYRDFVEKLISKYNEKAEENAKDKEAQYKFQEQLKDIQTYTDTLNQLQEAEEALYDLNNQILDVKIQQITYKIEYENEMDSNDLRLINFSYDQIADNAYRSAEAIDLMAVKSSYLLDELHRYETGFFDILGQYFDTELTDKMKKLFYDDPTKFAQEWQKMMEEDIRFQDITDPHKNVLEQYMDRMVDIISTMQDNYDDVIEKMSDDIKTFGKALDGLVDKFDYFDSVYSSLNNIIGLTNRSLTNIDSTFMKTLSAQSLDNSINKLRGARRELESMQQALNNSTAVYQTALAALQNYTGNDEEYKKKLQDEVDVAKKALDTVIEYNENATKQFYQAWENCLKKVQESYKALVEEAGRDYEKSISPLFLTLDLLQNQYDKEKELNNLYVKDYQRLHDLSKLNRDIQNSILDTDNLKSKERLRDLQKEINDLQDSGVELSEYDLNILDKKYKLELARQALEDARDAKSLVRLTRDNNGNWGYIYTSNEDDVAEAEQNYEDAIQEMEQANEDYIDNLQEQIIAVTTSAKQALENLNPADFNSQEEFDNYVNSLIQYYQDKLNFMVSQFNNAANNNTALAPDIQKMYDNLDHNLTNSFGDSLLSTLMGTDNLNQVADNIMNSIAGFANKAVEGYATIYSEMQQKVYEIAGTDIATAAGSFSDLIKVIADSSIEQVDIINTEANRMDEAYASTINSILAYQTTLDSLIQETELLKNTLASMNTFLRSSGEYVPQNTLYESFQTAYKDINLLSGGYTGRWQSALSGMYTGEWSGGSTERNGRLAFLHQKELVLNEHDTENFLNAMEIVRQLDNLTNWMSNGLGDLLAPTVKGEDGILQQDVHIDASFPNVTDHNEIEMAFDNLVNKASQYANRK